MHLYQVRLQSRNATAAAQVEAMGNQSFESTISAALNRHHEEEIQLIKDNLAKTVRTSISYIYVELLTQSRTYRQGKTSKYVIRRLV